MVRAIANTDKDTISVRLGVHNVEFERVSLSFGGGNVTDVFRFKNNKTVRETVDHPRHEHLRGAVSKAYADSLGAPLGEFLFALKSRGDPFYRRFLNPYGDEVYCSFGIEEPSVLQRRGVYLYAVDGHVRYVGRCLDTFGKRINQGYGRIHSKNCFIDGQSTNCGLGW